MRVPACAKAVTLALTLAAALAGCGSETRDGKVGADAVINYGSFGSTAEIGCGNGKSLSVNGSNNTLTVSGRCASVRVGGSDNTITLAQVDGELSVVGINNTITYKAGDPAVDDAGSGNRIDRR